MSKLNDSTLKILKKYRLDTDMSVFGNENKLYDVVKVMDDMVGNQVSKYVGNAYYFDSNTNVNISTFGIPNGISQPKTVPCDLGVDGLLSDVIVFDKLSMKMIAKYNKNSQKICVGYANCNTDLIGYIVIDFPNKTVGCYKDINGLQLIDVNLTYKNAYITWYGIFSNLPVNYSLNSSPTTCSALFGEYSSDNLTGSVTLSLPKIVNNLIQLPSYISEFENIYINTSNYGYKEKSSNTNFQNKIVSDVLYTQQKLIFVEV